MSQNRKLTSLVSVIGLIALTGSLVAACGDDGAGGGSGSCGELSGRVSALTDSAAVLTDLAGDIKVQVATACAGIAGMAPPTGMPSDEQVTTLCNAATATLDATLTAQVSLVIVPPICTVNAEAQFDCEAECYAAAEVTCDPGEVDVRCEPGELSVTCEGTCEADAYCEATGGVAVTCEGTCEGTCQGMCDGTCEGNTASGGMCNGSCDGTCDGQCEGSCKIEAEGGINCGANAKCRGGCEGTATAPSCTGELRPPACEAMAEVDCSADCSGSASLDAECSEPEVRLVGVADAAVATRIQANLPVILEVAKKGTIALDSVGRIGTAVVDVGGDLAGCALEINAGIAAAFTGAVQATVAASASVSVSFEASASVSAEASGSAG